jgi:hypothetical protein
MATAGGAALTLYGDGIDMMIQWYDGERIVIGNGIDMMIKWRGVQHRPKMCWSTQHLPKMWLKTSTQDVIDDGYDDNWSNGRGCCSIDLRCVQQHLI